MSETNTIHIRWIDAFWTTAEYIRWANLIGNDPSTHFSIWNFYCIHDSWGTTRWSSWPDACTHVDTVIVVIIVVLGKTIWAPVTAYCHVQLSHSHPPSGNFTTRPGCVTVHTHSRAIGGPDPVVAWGEDERQSSTGGGRDTLIQTHHCYNLALQCTDALTVLIDETIQFTVLILQLLYGLQAVCIDGCIQLLSLNIEGCI